MSVNCVTKSPKSLENVRYCTNRALLSQESLIAYSATGASIDTEKAFCIGLGDRLKR